jgi:hypothetical protein
MPNRPPPRTSLSWAETCARENAAMWKAMGREPNGRAKQSVGKPNYCAMRMSYLDALPDGEFTFLEALAIWRVTSTEAVGRISLLSRSNLVDSIGKTKDARPRRTGAKWASGCYRGLSENNCGDVQIHVDCDRSRMYV